jgi:predicted DCC family thiol-disulfide oxidoreductase YuxK
MTTRTNRSGALLYDQDCGICLATAAWLATRVGSERLGLLALADAQADPRIGPLLQGRSLGATVHFVRSDNLVLTGARAVLAAGRLVPRWRLLAIAFDNRPGHLLLEPLYRQVASNRRRIGRALGLPVACPLPPRPDEVA